MIVFPISCALINPILPFHVTLLPEKLLRNNWSLLGIELSVKLWPKLYFARIQLENICTGNHGSGTRFFACAALVISNISSCIIVIVGCFFNMIEVSPFLQGF